MATIVTRSGKGSALSHTEMDANFTNLNNDKAELSGATFTGSISDPNGLLPFPSGTLMLFQQTAAPTGWTKQTTHNDKALRVVSGTVGSGGTGAFTTTFGSGKSTDSFTLLEAHIPSHTHGASGTHTHDISHYKVGSGSSSGEISTTSNSNNETPTTNAGGNHTHASFGGGGGHSHGLTNFDLQYVDLIIASKD